MTIDKIVSVYQLDEGQRMIAEVIGLEAYKELVKNYGGSYLYVHKADTILRESRNQDIINNFDGGNYLKLAQKYNLSEKTIREIISKK